MAILSLPLLRTIVFGVGTLFSLITLALSAAALANSTANLNGYDAFEALAVATSLLTFVSLPVMWFIDRSRRGAFTSLVVVEVSWLSFLWILWLATAADTANATSLVFSSGCGLYRRWLLTLCQEVLAVEAFSFLLWILLLGYTITLAVFAFRSSGWRSTVKDLTWNGGVHDSEKGPISPAPAPSSYPPTPAAHPYPQQSPAPTTQSPPPPSTYTTEPGYPGGFQHQQPAHGQHPSGQYPSV